VTDTLDLCAIGAADPTTEAFWKACMEHRLLIQKCDDCGHHQFYPRPFCLNCESKAVVWVEAGGGGTVYSMTTVRVPVIGNLEPPYVVGLVDLDEGPRLLTNIDGPVAIDDRVELAWKQRDGLPPLPVFETTGD
jgi:uncharacterized OB-fold protein